MKPFNIKNIDRSTLRLGIHIFLLLAAVILFEKVIGNVPAIGGGVKEIFLYLVRLGSPFFLGFAFAYLMNPLMKFMENQAFQWIPFAAKHKRLTRSFCIIINYIIVIGGLIWITIYLVPEVKTSTMAFVNQVPTYSAQLNKTINDLFMQADFIDGEDINQILNSFLIPLEELSKDIPKLLGDVVSNLYTLGMKAVELIMALFISFYMLFDKEAFVKQSRKMVYALTSEERANHLFYNGSRINHIFQDFIVGKALDSAIIGVLAFIGFTLIRAPFPLILSLIIGVTNMIPYFGPIIGAIPAVFITLLISPVTAIWVGLFILLLQQFDGNFLGPKILGDSLDVSPVLIILAVVLGGATLGPLGMFIGVPILATVKMFAGEYIEKQYQQKYQASDPLDLLTPEQTPDDKTP